MIFHTIKGHHHHSGAQKTLEICIRLNLAVINMLGRDGRSRRQRTQKLKSAAIRKFVSPTRGPPTNTVAGRHWLLYSTVKDSWRGRVLPSVSLAAFRHFGSVLWLA